MDLCVDLNILWSERDKGRSIELALSWFLILSVLAWSILPYILVFFSTIVIKQGFIHIIYSFIYVIPKILRLSWLKPSTNSDALYKQGSVKTNFTLVSALPGWC